VNVGGVAAGAESECAPATPIGKLVERQPFRTDRVGVERHGSPHLAFCGRGYALETPIPITRWISKSLWQVRGSSASLVEL